MNWRDRRVMVTGADGFIGSHLVEALHAAGARVRAFCLYNSNGSLGWLDHSPAEVRADLDIRLGDVRDSGFVEDMCADVEVVFHLAALIAIPYSYCAPESFVDTNVRGTLNVLKGVQRAQCARLIHTSTSEVYGTPDVVPITEDHPLKGQSPYSATKIAADKLVEAYHCSFEIPAVTLRPFNTYGPRQSERAVIPTILAQLLSGQQELRLGSLDPKRDLTFVADTVAGFLAAGLAPGVEGQTIQLGTGRAESVGRVVELAKLVCDAPDVAVVTDPDRVRPRGSEVMILQSSPQRAADLLQWKAEVSLETGLERTADWIRGRLEQFRPEVYVV